MSTQRMLLEPAKRLSGWHRAVVERSAPIEEAAEGQVDRLRPLAVSHEAAEQSGRPLSRIARAKNQDRARRLLEQKLEYVYDRSFDEADAAARFLGPLTAATREPRAKAGPRTGLPLSLDSFYGNATPLQPEEEASLFLKMNYLKYRASKLRDALDPFRARASELAEIERFQGEALAVKNHIVQSCLRLVVSIAKRREGPDRTFWELVSEGNLSLILAAEKFDVSRGFKFSTYASCVIARAFARTSVQEISRRRRFVTGQQDLFATVAARRTDEDKHENGPHGQKEAIRRMLDGLSDREREIIVSRFGLEGARAKTLLQLGQELGITRERVRQIESRAREKLRILAREQGLDPTAA